MPEFGDAGLVTGDFLFALPDPHKRKKPDDGRPALPWSMTLTGQRLL
jgi:hypothetical protein